MNSGLSLDIFKAFGRLCWRVLVRNVKCGNLFCLCCFCWELLKCHQRLRSSLFQCSTHLHYFWLSVIIIICSFFDLGSWTLHFAIHIWSQCCWSQNLDSRWNSQAKRIPQRTQSSHLSLKAHFLLCIVFDTQQNFNPLFVTDLKPLNSS